MAFTIPEEMDRFITLKEIPNVMEAIGVKRGFSRSSLNRKIAQGNFDVPYIMSGHTRLFRPSDVIAHWNRLPKQVGPVK
ncbi:hypothetical protein OAJ23_02330 [Pelagibacteraceae bacterium]|jgi:hypothetical protein|nr:hypothetical protein [Pelagibacteraceae bacterium]|tara:strand:+ start:544 stop:780 length:237 start_codon:yes stop_codon:yes gene_type:complete